MGPERVAMILTVVGWFVVVAPVPQSLGKFDASAPMDQWQSHSPMFKTKAQCESFRGRTAHGAADLNRNQFIDDSATLIVPLWASRCVNVAVPAV